MNIEHPGLAARFAVRILMAAACVWAISMVPLPAVGAPVTAPTEIDQKMQTALDRRLPEIKFEGNALADVVEFLRDVTGLNIFVNWGQLEKAGVTKEAPVTLRVRDVSMSKALKLVLESAENGKAALDFTVDRGVITISTAESLGTDIVSSTYDVGALLSRAASAQPATMDARGAALVKLITGAIAPKSWKDAGGVGEISFGSGKLTVKQTKGNQQCIKNLVDQLGIVLR